MTTTDLSILVPVLNRPDRVEPVLRSALKATPDAEVLFIADPDDDAELEALEAAGADFISPGGTYPQKINHAVRKTSRPLIFTGADDIEFIPGWYEDALEHLTDHSIYVVGITDEVTKRNRRGHHAPHFLMTREYAVTGTIDGGAGPFSTQYKHCFCDDEFVATARKRGVIVIDKDIKTKHSHPYNGSAETDSTYELGQSFYRRDSRIFKHRRMMWR